MAQTPEGKVKDAQQEYFRSLGMIRATKPNEDALRICELEDATGWYYMPMQSGMGVNGISDFIGHYHGYFFSIEAKRVGLREKPRAGASAHQQLQGNAITASGGFWIVADCVEQIKPWFEKIKEGL